jgi:hypothetical protein
MVEKVIEGVRVVHRYGHPSGPGGEVVLGVKRDPEYDRPDGGGVLNCYAMSRTPIGDSRWTPLHDTPLHLAWKAIIELKVGVPKGE